MKIDKIFITLLTICLSFCSLAPKSYAEIPKEIDIATSPHKVLFEIKNVRPGDTYLRKLVVQNNGSEDFRYLFSNRFLRGSEKLYKELLLVVSDNNGELFNGNLNDFVKLDSRYLKSNVSDELTLSVTIPLELGNEYQSLNSEFEFKFYVEGTLGGVLPADGPKLPATGSNMFNILLAGSVLVLGGSILQFFLKRRNRLEKHS